MFINLLSFSVELLLCVIALVVGFYGLGILAALYLSAAISAVCAQVFGRACGALGRAVFFEKMCVALA